MEKIEKGRHLVNLDTKTIGFGHVTKTSDGEIELTTYFDFSKVDLKRLLYDAGTARLIKWRASSGIKDLTTDEARKKFAETIVDCSAVVEREKHVLTPAEKRMRELVAIVQKSPKGSPERAAARKELLAMWSEDEDEAQDAMEQGETAA